MITKWKVFNFKSVRKETELEFAPLTIFAGPNSSGKSTFLQSILLIAQTFLHRARSRSVILNGSLARLGQFDDICSTGSEANQILIGFDCQTPGKDDRDQTDERISREESALFGYYNEGNLKRVSCEIAFDADPSSPQRDLYQLQPRLFSCILNVQFREKDRERKFKESQSFISIVNAATSGETQASKMRRLLIPDPEDDVARSSLDWNVSLDAQSLEDIREKFRTGEPAGCTMRQFLPMGLSLKIDRGIENSFILESALFEGRSGQYLNWRRFSRFNDIKIPDTVGQLIYDTLSKAILAKDKENILADSILAPGLKKHMFLSRWFSHIDHLKNEERLFVQRALGNEPGLREAITEAFQRSVSSKFELVLQRLPGYLQLGTAYLEKFFSTSIKYLGPLRDDPKAIYPLSDVHDPFDVGLRGERTAAVLDSHKGMQVRYIPSQCFVNPEIEIVPTMRTLEAAVADWLNYLGVAASVKTKDRGKFGHELKVNVSDEGRAHDLTHVGVGVSQVLPILVMSLLASRDTTLIFEQPEIHLHPRVQTLLADFFLSIIALGTQCIVETHSEYLINRLRFRVAAAKEDNPRVSAMKIYFVEKPSESSTFREVKVNDYGAVTDWPEGFFDQSQREAEEILKAAMMKKRQRGIKAKSND